MPQKMGKIAQEMEQTIASSKRKLLEFEVFLAQAELVQGESKRFSSAKALVSKAS